MSRTRMVRVFGWLSLLALATAAWTGVLLRFGLAGRMPPWAANFSAIRHAHSHLMYFGWVTLALMALIWYRMPLLTGRPLPRAAVWQLAITALAAFVSFPAFWVNGYGLTAVGDASLPLGSMAASLSGLTWFWFVALYVRETRRLAERSVAIQLWDWSILLLIFACLGAAGLVAMVRLGGESIFLQLLFLHLFLDLFAAGWFTLATLGLVWDMVLEGSTDLPRLPVMTLALATVPTFVLGMPAALVPVPLARLALVANAVTAMLLAWHLIRLWQRQERFTLFGRFALVMFGIYVVGAFVLSWPGVWRWAGGTQLRVYHLHVFLLGWISSMVLDLLLQRTLWRSYRPVRGLAAPWIIGVSAMVLCLLGIGLIAWLPIGMMSLLRGAAWFSIVPAAVATVLLFAPAATTSASDNSRST